MKYCPACKQDKPESEFYLEKGRNGGGLSSNCKECKKARNRKNWKERYYPENKERLIAAVEKRREDKKKSP